MRTHPLFILLIIGIFSIAGSCNEDIEQNGTACNTIGVLKDYTGLDGCHWVIETQEETFEVLSFPENYIPEDGKQIKFGYEVVDAMSICMVGRMINLKCVINLGNSNCTAIKMVEGFEIDSMIKPSFRVLAYETVGRQLHLQLQYGGCSPERNFQLHVSNQQINSEPPQSEAVLSFEEQLCKALFQKTVCFDMSALKRHTVLHIQSRDSVYTVYYNPKY